MIFHEVSRSWHYSNMAMRSLFPNNCMHDVFLRHSMSFWGPNKWTSRILSQTRPISMLYIYYQSLKFVIILFLKVKVGPNILPMSKVCCNCSLRCSFFLHFSTQNQDMCHDVVGIGMIKIQVPTRSTFIPIMMKILVLHGLLMRPWLEICAFYTWGYPMQ